MQRLNNFMRERGDQERKSPSGKLKLLDRIPLRKLVVFDAVQAATSKESLQIAEEL